MKFSIATVSLGGTLTEKLPAIAKAGFEGVEIFEADVLAHEASPREIGRIVRDHGLEIVAFQPFRDFEGMPEPQRSRGLERARRKFELMNELGADRILVCSNVSPASLGGIDRCAEDLRAMGDIARDFGIEVGFEALAWGRHVSDYRDAWEIVRRADHPSIGLILDSWHTLARGHPCDPIRSIPADRMTFVQLADAPRMEMDLLQWSRHFRNFPGQGDLPVGDFLEAVLATGYDGWLSLEILPFPHGLAAAHRRGRRALADLADGPRQAGRDPVPRQAAGGRVDRVCRLRGRCREAGRALRRPRLPPRRPPPLQGGHALDPGRDQPRHQHRTRGARAFAPDHARALGRRHRPAGRRSRRRDPPGARAPGPEASPWDRASSISRRSAASAVR